MTIPVFSGSGPARPAPQPQAPYVLDATGNPVTTLPPSLVLPQPLAGPIWLESAWAMVIPGLPWLPGLTSSIHPERCLTWFLGAPLWKPWIDKILTAACVRGCNHFTLSWPDCRDSCGMTVQTFTALAAYVKSWGFKVHVKWWSKDGSDPQNSDWPTMQAWVSPILNALMSAKAVDAVSPWEWNANNIAGPQGEAILDGVAAMVTPNGVEPWIHFGPECVWWGAPDSNRDAFWQARMASGHLGIHYQAEPSNIWNMGLLQARILDSTNHPGFVNTGARFILWEQDGAEMFDGDQPDEPTAAGHAYIGLCTPGLMPVTGIGQGPWLPDGRSCTAA